MSIYGEAAVRAARLARKPGISPMKAWAEATKDLTASMREKFIVAFRSAKAAHLSRSERRQYATIRDNPNF